jgi:hypothetical protein
MTLPYPDKPAITDAVRTILSNTKDNFASLDEEPKFKACTFAKDLSTTGDVATTGIGFSPRVILFFAEEPVSDAMSWGIYSYGSVPDNAVVIMRGTGDSAGLNVTRCISLAAPGGIQIAQAYVSSRDADGFTLTWSHPSDAASGTATIIAFCIR